MRSIKSLKHRITLLFTLLTGLVLFAAFLLAGKISVGQLRSGFAELTELQMETVVAKVQSQSVNAVDLYWFEQQNNLLVLLNDKGRWIEPAIQNQPELREEFIGQFDKNFASDIAKDSFTIPLADGKNWQGEYRLVDGVNGSWYGKLYEKPTEGLDKEIGRLLVTYVLLFLFFLLVLGGVSYLLAIQAIKPVKKAHAKQLEFTTAAGHDLRSPLAVIQSSAEMILKDTNNTTEYITNITGESKRMGRLIEELLVLSAGDAEKWQVVLSKVESESLLISVYEKFLPLATEHGYFLRLDLPEKLLFPVLADKERVVQILGTLLSNAFAYSVPGTGIEIQAQARRQFLDIKVVDHGPGIDEEGKTAVFERFYREDKSRTTREHFGLGLSVAAQLAQMQGAKLTVEDTPGGGATFLLSLKKYTGQG